MYNNKKWRVPLSSLFLSFKLISKVSIYNNIYAVYIPKYNAKYVYFTLGHAKNIDS